ncbi:MAG: hypothetical protein JW940_08420 [Polyangiaceae bacterium]|nr:hypothetical protein [Polyangiaceae bacterium]
MTSNAKSVRVSRSTSVALTVGVAFALTAVRSHAQPAPAEQPGAAQPPAASPAPASDNPAGAPATAQPADAAPSEVPAGEAQPEAAPSEPTEAYPPAPVALEESEASADSEADLAAELAASEIAAQAQSQGPKLDVYGFADFTYARRLTHHDSDIVMPPMPTFYVGNFNLYLGAKLDRWRSLSEVRFTYLPDGAMTFEGGGFGRVSASYGDYSDWGRSKKVGGVIIERAWLEYSAHSLITIRGGQFLTPYGIWNVDHGSPVVIGTTRPFIVGNEWLPSHQTGLEVYGSQGFGQTQLGYHLTLSNGRGPIDTYQDLDKNKAFGWRVWAKQDSSIGTFGLGASGYRGRYTDSTLQVEASGDEFVMTNPVTARYDELALAADFKWTWGEYVLQSEAIVQDVRYDDRFRPSPQFARPGAPPAWTPDQRVWGYYALTGYRLPWWGVMPFVMGQYQDWGPKNGFTCYELSGGLNIRPNEMVVFKLATLWLWRSDPGVYSKNEAQFSAQAAWSF